MPLGDKNLDLNVFEPSNFKTGGSYEIEAFSIKETPA